MTLSHLLLVATMLLVGCGLPQSGGIGDACDPQDPCAQGLFCGEGPGGYCSKLCDSDDGCAVIGWIRCIARPGEQGHCYATCTRDADCRTSEGYACIDGICDVR
jgi:hypothetical protein